MLDNNFFYHALIRKYVVLFGSLFNNTVINRTDANNNITQIVNVPIAYASKDKILTRQNSDPAINRPDSIILPRMSFEIMDVKYDSSRKLKSVGIQSTDLSNTSVTTVYNPVPYDILFNLFVYVKNNEDGAKIIEQILPFFTPSFNVNAFLLPGYPSVSIPILLDSIHISDTNTEDLKDRRVMIWNLTFTMKGYFYGPVTNNRLIINLTNISLSDTNFTEDDDFIYNYGLDDLQTGDLFVNK